MSRHLARFVAGLLLAVMTFATHAGKITIAAAADLKFAMEEIAAAYKLAHPGNTITVVYGSSGKFHTQIRQGAPYDLYFSADIAYPRELAKAGFAATAVVPYAIGRIVLWSNALDARTLTLESLAGPRIKRIAIANPRHAPYGKRAEEALRATGLWDQVANKLVYGENIAQAAQFVQTGNAQAGIIALSLALSPELANVGIYAVIPDNLHEPLEQGFIVTRRAKNNRLAHDFAAYIDSPAARAVMKQYGFVLPGER